MGKSASQSAVLVNPKYICSEKDCGRKRVAKGLCDSHYKRTLIDRQKEKGRWTSHLIRPYVRKNEQV